MSEGPFFPQLESAARRLGSRTDLTPGELRSLLCHDCDFFTEDHEDELECSCFRLLGVLLARRVLTPETLAEALRSDVPPDRHE